MDSTTTANYYCIKCQNVGWYWMAVSDFDVRKFDCEDCHGSSKLEQQNDEAQRAEEYYSQQDCAIESVYGEFDA